MFKKRDFTLLLLATFFVFGNVLTNPYGWAEEKITLHFWELAGGRNVYENYVIEKYQKLHPNIEVKLTTYTSEVFKSAISSALRTENPPDIFQLWREGVLYPIFLKAGYFYPLTKAYKEFGWDKELGPFIVERMTGPDGEIYGVPLTRYTTHFIYGKNVFEKYGLKEPETWSEFRQLCETLKGAGIVPIAEGDRELYKATQWLNVAIEREIGARNLDILLTESCLTGATNIVRWTDPKVVKGIEKIEYLVKRGYFNEGVNGMSEGDAMMLVMHERAAMIFTASYAFHTFFTKAPDFRIGIFNYPQINKEIRLTNAGWWGGCLRVANKSKYKKQALDFLRFLFDEEQLKFFAEMTHQIPAMKSGQKYVKSELMKEVAESVNMPFSSCTDAWSPAVYDAECGEFQNLIEGKITAKEFAERLEKVAEKSRRGE